MFGNGLCMKSVLFFLKLFYTLLCVGVVGLILNLIQRYLYIKTNIMSKEMREQIVKIKNFGEFLNEDTSKLMYKVKLKPNTLNKNYKWYYKDNKLVGNTFTVMNGYGDFSDSFVIQTKGGSGGTYHFSKDDVDIIEVL